MSIDRLRYFAAVVETLNLRKASELVGISPPSMSKAISVLESELGHKLIYPDGRGIGITDKGVDIYKKSAKVLEEYQKFFQNIESGLSESSTLRIATFEVFSSYFLTNFILDNPEFDIFHIEKTPGHIEESVLSGITDIGITYIPSPNPKLEFIEIGTFKNLIFGSKALAESPFSKIPFAIPTTELSNFTSDIDALDMWPRSAPKRLIKYRLELLETALQICRKGLAAIHCPNFIVNLHNQDMTSANQLIEFPKPRLYGPSKTNKVFIVKRKGHELGLLEGKLAKFFRKLSRL